MDAVSTIVLRPGLDGTSVLFAPVIEELALDALPVDYPQQLPSGYADLLPFVLGLLPADRRFILLGWSFSGPLALLAAATRPPGLAGVVLCASFVRKPQAMVPAWAAALAWPRLFRYFAHFARAKALFGRHATPELLELLSRAHSRVPPEVMAERVKATLRVNVEAELRACRVPMLYLGAESDRVVPRANARHIRRLRPEVTVDFIPGSHLALATHPKAAAKVLERFAIL